MCLWFGKILSRTGQCPVRDNVPYATDENNFVLKPFVGDSSLNPYICYALIDNIVYFYEHFYNIYALINANS